MEKNSDSKIEEMRKNGTLNPKHAEVEDELFESSVFFDAHDLVQVKYEMLRRVEKDGLSISDAAKSFGLSRPTYYEAREALDKSGIVGLQPKQRGPKVAHKITKEVLGHANKLLEKEPNINTAELAAKICSKFEIEIHPRSLIRALKEDKKKKAST